MKIKRRYDWHRQTLDPRDDQYPFQPDLTVPRTVDLRPKCPPVVDQGQIGSCTANALAAALAFLEMREIAQGAAIAPEEFQGEGFKPFSRLFIYWNERVIEGNPHVDSGANLRDGIKSLQQLGACEEDFWPYDPTAVLTPPNGRAFDQALVHRIRNYMAVPKGNLTSMRQCLASGFPFVFGFTAFDSLEGPAVARTGMLPLPKPSDRPIGGHAVMAVGYDDPSKLILVRNSWGIGWGLQGYFWMPYAYFVNPDLSADFWTIRL